MTTFDVRALYEWVAQHWKIPTLIATSAKALKMWFDLRKSRQDLRNSNLEGERLKAENAKLRRDQKVRDLLLCMERDEAEAVKEYRAKGNSGTLFISDDQWLEHFTSRGEADEIVREALRIFNMNKAAAAAAEVTSLPERLKPRF